MIKNNVYSILSIFSPFLGLGLIVNGIADNYYTEPLALLFGVILGVTLAVVSLFKKEKKLLSFIALAINIGILVLVPALLF